MSTLPAEKKRRLSAACDQRVLRIGTDCSGIDVCVAMLQDLIVERGVQHRYEVEHVFSSEVDPAARAIIEHNFGPRHLFADLTKRALYPAPGGDARSAAASLRPAASELSDLDIYVAGFPCQPWSTAGKQQGFKDKKGRGLIWTHILQFLVVAKPKCAILENVVGITQGRHKLSFARMLSMIEDMDAFDVQYKVLNTRDFGVAQNRERVFVILLRKDCLRHTSRWPEKTAASLSPSLDAFLDAASAPVDLTALPKAAGARRKCVAALSEMLGKGLDPRRTPAACSINNRRAATMLNCSPCLTAARASEGGHWLLHRARFMTDDELFRLQGLTPIRWQLPPSGATKKDMRACLGNAISGNVIKLLLAAVLQALGFLD